MTDTDPFRIRPPTWAATLVPGVCLLAALGLGACAEPGPSADGPRTVAPPDGDAPAPSSAADRLSGAVLGTYDADAAACARTTTMSRLVVSPDTLRFYYGYATVDSVAARDGGYSVGATLYHQEGAVRVVPEPATYRLDVGGDGLRLARPGTRVPPSDLVRCDAAETGGGRPADDGRSAYTNLDLGACETLREYEESGGVELRCPGYQGVPLFVSRGDLRYDVDAGVPNDAWETPTPFNSLGETVEWRLRDGEPSAVIVRYQIAGPSGRDERSRLAVIAVGREGAPGCLVGYVGADAEPSQNAAARALADRQAGGSACD